MPLRGKPEALTEGAPVSVRVQTEAEAGAQTLGLVQPRLDGLAEVRANSSISPQRDPRRRRLHLAVARASGSAAGLHRPRQRAALPPGGRIYEFQSPAVLHAIRLAAQTGAAVRMVYDAITDGNGPAEKNLAAVRDAEIKDFTKGRTEGKLMHNKFLILVKDGQPQAVWTGSTNVTENGLFGHSNIGQVIEDPAVARAYLAYWQALEDDPTTPELKDWTGTDNAAPPDPWVEDQTVVFSPRRGMAVLDWYAEIARGARRRCS